MFYYTSYHLMQTGASGAPDLAAADIFSAAVLKVKRSRAMSKFHKVVLFYPPAFFEGLPLGLVIFGKSVATMAQIYSSILVSHDSESACTVQ